MRAVFEEIETAFGRVPNLFRAYANFPPLLEANWEKTKAVMTGGEIPQHFKEAIALVVSRDNGCDYCVAAHSMAPAALDVSPESMDRLLADEEAERFADHEMALLRFARRANENANAITDEECRQLQGHGWTQAHMVEALGVVELFAGFNRFLDSLIVPIDF